MIQYVPYHEPEFLEYSPENGQVITKRVNFCKNWRCQSWLEGQQLAPKLTEDRVCPKCRRPG
jgi:hypothetical protein